MKSVGRFIYYLWILRILEFKIKFVTKIKIKVVVGQRIKTITEAPEM